MPDITLQQAREMGVQLLTAGQLEQAASVFSQILSQVPDDADSIHFLGLAFSRRGNPQRAIDLITRAIALRPDAPTFYYNLADAQRNLGRIADAESSLRRAISLKPDFADAHENLGVLLLMRHQPEQAARSLENALRLNPASASAHANLAHIHRSAGMIERAIDHCRKAVGLAPNSAEFHNQLGSLLREIANVREAVAEFRRAVELRPSFQAAHSNLLFALHFDPDCAPEHLLAEHRHWAQCHADPLTPADPRHNNDPSAGRRLRIGYVSPDLRQHIIGLLLTPILHHHDRQAFEIICYSGVAPAEGDDLTARIRSLCDLWRDTAGVSDERLAGQIADDCIDILIDLTLHMRQNRLPVFARKPAPVQATFIAYPSTSGMRAMDYVITDAHIDPPDRSEAFHTERLARLPHTLWCFAAPDRDVEVSDLPAKRNGFVTFASLNSFAKVNPPTLRLWGDVLRAVPNSRLLMLVPGGETGNPSLRGRLAEFGIHPQRVHIVPTAPRDHYLRYFHEADITLDPLHYTGHTTSLDSLYMGIPIITLPGRHPVSRVGVTYLRNLDLTELIASSPQDYVHLAAELANDMPRLAALRSGLRERMRRSPLMDAATYTRHLERLYRQMWQTWCNSRASQ